MNGFEATGTRPRPRTLGTIIKLNKQTQTDHLMKTLKLTHSAGNIMAHYKVKTAFLSSQRESPQLCQLFSKVTNASNALNKANKQMPFRTAYIGGDDELVNVASVSKTGSLPDISMYFGGSNDARRPTYCVDMGLSNNSIPEKKYSENYGGLPDINDIYACRSSGSMHQALTTPGWRMGDLKVANDKMPEVVDLLDSDSAEGDDGGFCTKSAAKVDKVDWSLCAVCLDEGPNMFLERCRHEFCEKCLTSMKTLKTKLKCPQCKIGFRKWYPLDPDV